MAEDSKELRDIVERARNLDSEAFGRLYDVYYESIYKYAFFKTGSSVEAEDIASQVFTGALRTIKNFTWGNASFSSWLFRIANNTVADFWRKRGRVTIETIENHPFLEDGSDVAETVAGRFRFRELYEALAKLPDDQSQVIILKFISGLSARETAAIMGKTVGAVKAQQFRALEKLKGLMMEKVMV